ncbi:MAG: porin [Parvularculaceae bacterium]
MKLTKRHMTGLALSASLAPWAAFAADPIEVDVEGDASVVAGVSDGEDAADLDAEVRVNASTVFQSGVEVGAILEGRLDGQQPDRLFAGGRFTGLLIGGPRGVAPNGSDAFLQSAYAYARGGFGRVNVGRTEGVARTLAVKAPTLFRAFNVNDWRTDLTGLNDVHTINDFSGQATKISYLPPANAFGGVLGGVQLGVSYSPTLPSCADGACAPEGRLLITPEGLLVPEDSSWDDVIEAALYYQKEIKVGATEGLFLGLGASYVTADERSLVDEPIFGDYEALSLGLNLGFRGITVGGSIKTTNAGLANTEDDSYLAFDAGITFQTGDDRGDWGFSLGYGRSEADLIGPAQADPTLFQDTQTAQAGVTFFVARGVTIGAAAQFVEANRPVAAGGQDEAFTGVIESSIKF